VLSLANSAHILKLRLLCRCALCTIFIVSIAHPQGLLPYQRGNSGPAAPGPDLAKALDAARAAIAACAARGVVASASVVDSAGVLKVLLSADGAPELTVLSGQRKAISALAFNMPTSELRRSLKSDQALAEKFSSNPNYRDFPGGIPLYAHEMLIGAIGVSGASNSDTDELCAQEGVKALAAAIK